MPLSAVFSCIFVLRKPLWYGVLANICTLRHLNTAAKYDI